MICETLIHLILFAITDVFSNLLLSKIIINPHIFTYTRLEIYTPSSAFSTVFDFRSLYPNRYKTSCNITHILHYLRPFQVLSVAYAGLTFGNSESNITINGGVLASSSSDNYYSSGRSSASQPAISLSWNQRVSSNASFMGEVWLLGNTIVGGPGMRFYSGRKNTIDFAILGGKDLSSGGDGIFGIPFISWTRKMGK